MRANLILREPMSAHKDMLALWPTIKAWLLANHKLELIVRPARRTSEQNARFHAMCGDIAKHCEWMGKRRTPEQWKVLLVSGHAIATKEGSDIVPGLENEFVNLRESTAQMSVKRGSSLIDYALAYGDMNGVQWSNEARANTPERYSAPQDAGAYL